MPHTTVVMMSWRRPDNVKRILASLSRIGAVAEVIVWNNNTEVWLESDRPIVRIVNSNSDLGLYTRFAAAALARTDSVLFQDDDLLLPESTLKTLLSAWEGQPTKLHGIFGRRPNATGQYADLLTGDRSAPIVLTRAVVTARAHIPEALQLAYSLDSLQTASRPYGNGEDIILSYAARRRDSGPHRIYGLPVQELSDDHGIHRVNGWRQHVEHRTMIMQACERWLALQSI